MSIVVKKFRMHLKKEPFLLKKSLDLLDEKGLPGYKIIEKKKIQNPHVLEELGTKDYIQWILEDIDEPADSPVRNYSLFITYYGLPDRVPHVPEECYAGVGHQRLNAESMILIINNGLFSQKIPAKQLVFSRKSQNFWQGETKFSVLYLFNVNGVYANSRQDARLVLNKNIFGRHSYFCKVEWNFFNDSNYRTSPKKEQAFEASEKLLSVILPVLEKEHWPEYDDLNP